MAYIIWLLLMGVVIGFMAFPIAQRIGYAYGRFGRTGDMLAIVFGTMLGGILLAFLGGLLGFWVTDNTGGAIVGGIIGAVVTMVLLGMFATKAAEDEPNKQDEIS